MRYLISIIMIVFIALPTLAKDGVVVDKVVAVVNNEVITFREVKKASNETNNKNLSQMLNKLISNMLLDQKIKESKMAISDDELAAAIRRIILQNGMSVEVFHKEVQKQGMTYDEYTKRLRKELLRNKFINQSVGSQLKISDRDLRDYYDKYRKDYPGDFESERDVVYEALYNQKLPQAISAYVARVRREAFVSIKDEALVSNNR